VNGPAVDKRLKAMANKTSLPTKAELDALIEVLATTDDETDQANSLGELGSVETTNLAADLVTRLERGIQELRTNGEEAPLALTKTVDLLHQHIEQEATEEPVDPKEWIDALLAGERPTVTGTLGGGPAFRTLRMDLLTEDDLEILKEMAEEVRSQKES
jgi:hypothetical protein